jgi:hypothetical protein
MNSPRYAPAGLLIEYGQERVILDGGPGAVAEGKVSAWLVSDERSELIGKIRKLAKNKGLEPGVATFRTNGLLIEPKAVVHTSHPTWGYLVHVRNKKLVWAPEFLVFPRWARGADLMFAEAAGWKRAILFRGGVGGHASVDQVACDAQKFKVAKLVFSHIGRPTIRAKDAGLHPAFGEFGADGDSYQLSAHGEFVRRKTRKL